MPESLKNMFSGKIIYALLYHLKLLNAFTVAEELWQDRKVKVTCRFKATNINWSSDIERMVKKLGPEAVMGWAIEAIGEEIVITITISHVTFPIQPSADTEATENSPSTHEANN